MFICQGRALAGTESYEWHLAELTKLDGDLITPAGRRFVTLSSLADRDAAQWWLEEEQNPGRPPGETGGSELGRLVRGFAGRIHRSHLGLLFVTVQ